MQQGTKPSSLDSTPAERVHTAGKQDVISGLNLGERSIQRGTKPSSLVSTSAKSPHSGELSRHLWSQSGGRTYTVGKQAVVSVPSQGGKGPQHGTKPSSPVSTWGRA
jgi:hypothetical protein